MMTLVSNKVFYFLFLGIFLVGNILFSIVFRSLLRGEGQDPYHLFILVNAGFLAISYFGVVWISYKLRKKIFLYLFSAIVPILCVLAFVLFGFYSPFSLLSYFVIR
jgi:hypothetical protein